MQYQGSCHCGHITFEFISQTITEGLQCNCSICRRKNAVMSLAYFPANQFNVNIPLTQLGLYHWGDNDVDHYFCKNCGIFPFNRVNIDTEKFRVNLGCVDGVDIDQLTIQKFNGRDEL